MAAGVALWAPHGAQWHRSQALAGTGCNNEAELGALQMGLELAHAQAASSLRIYTDSRWLIEQLAPSMLMKHSARTAAVPRATQRLLPMLGSARQQLQALQEVQWRWVPRHCNTEADALARNAQGIASVV